MVKIKTICFDIDGIICTSSNNNDYIKSKPIKKNIKIINKLYDKGFLIIIFTGRYMGRNNNNIYKAKKQGLKLTMLQLRKWKVKYNKLFMGKPSYDLFIDDKSIFFKKQWTSFLKKKCLN
jgi:capsule biosynthesis phosphatase